MYTGKFMARGWILCLILIIIISCNTGKNQQIKKVDVLNDFPVIIGDTIVYPVDVIELDRNVGVWRILIIDSLIYALSSNRKVEIFNVEGKYKGQLGRRGEGPGEYVNPENIFQCQEHIGVHDPFKREILFYSNRSEYIYNIDISLEGGSFDILCEDRHLLIYPRSLNLSYPYHVWKVDRETGNFLKGYLPIDMDYAGYFNKGLFAGAMWRDGDSLFVFNSIYRKIFKINTRNDDIDTLDIILPKYLRKLKIVHMPIQATMREVEGEFETWEMQINNFYTYSDWYLMEIFVRADSNLGIVVYFVFNKTSEKAAYIIFPRLLFFTFQDGMFYQHRAELDRDFLMRYGVHWEKLRKAFERSR